MKSFMNILALWMVLGACGQRDDANPMTKGKVSIDENKEKEAILQVIDQETKHFFDGDYEGWKKNWSHQDYAIQAWNNDDGTSDVAVGWNKIDAQGKNWIEKYYKNGEIKIHPHYVRQNIQIKFFNENLAYLNWEQLNADAEKKYYRLSHEIRIMEKENDDWKIVNVSAFWDAKPKIPADSLELK